MYSVCTGGLLSADLCLCQPNVDHISPQPLNVTHLNQINKSNTSHALHRAAYKYFDPQLLINETWHQFGAVTTVHDVDPNAHKKCLYIVFRTHEAGGNFEAVNVCRDRVYNVGFSLTGENISFSSSLAVSHQVTPLSVHHIVSVLKQEVDAVWSWKYQLEFTEDNL
jgi:hypothetical protein